MQVNSRIEQKIEDIYAFVESCKVQALSGGTKVVVPKADLYDILDELRREVPEEIQRYQKILKQRDAILEDADRRSEAILVDAQEQYKALVEEHNIVQQAYAQADMVVEQANQQAQQIIETARRQASEMGNGAIYYTTDMLEMAEKVLASAYESSMANANALGDSLRRYLETIRANKAELLGTTPPPGPQATDEDTVQAPSQEEQEQIEQATEETEGVEADE